MGKAAARREVAGSIPAPSRIAKALRCNTGELIGHSLRA
jgi:hypothetical protein